ncbi:phosphoribosyl-ATP diphosphatase [Azospirillum endophyticum]|uniref:phosphoribosyl-ATP diphosphatase n=1 Tax=Azospirillum endophyticum TaxID=2800326 RepID=UPI001FFEB884|nr:phosphoribosyl-ATP diphosphatase [Azospirillum endophyticum]
MVQYIGPDPLRSLYDAVQTLRRDPSAVPEASRTARLLEQGRARMARKVGEEAIEVAIEAMRADRGALVMEAADLLYNLVVLLADLDIAPDEILAELRRRELAYGIAEKLPKCEAPTNGATAGPSKPVALDPSPAKPGSDKPGSDKSGSDRRSKR